MMTLGAQLYTLRSYTQNEKDLAFCLKKVAEMGYTTVQISAIRPDPSTKGPGALRGKQSEDRSDPHRCEPDPQRYRSGDPGA